MPLEDSWTSGGVEFKVITTKNEGETDAQHQARHDEAVEFWKEEHPPD